ncbi:AraC family transcriptional regulator [Salipiger sp. P9]|uniref:AraC family transcriptional regulator n=1 Tax=Salipiger pentaromativorans TaxID=2943193 RepID=UPI0021581805|nr:AraC family transcriptional regulator [Salipiger pentaromativorans]MCR8546474.1 AraC family transcriptional regulator [Salipiger pentaromativorans]
MDRRSISPGFVEDALACLRGQGIDAAPLLRQAGLPDPVTGPVSTDCYGRLWWLIAQAMQDEFFGLAARPMRPGSFALLCHAVLHARTLDQALRRALRFLDVVLDRPRGTLRVREGVAVITLDDGGPPRPAFAYRTYWLILMGLACWLIGRRIPLRHLDFVCAAPPHRQDYRQFFGAPVHFGQAQTSLRFDARYLRLPPVRSEQALAQFLREAPANILLRYQHDQGVAARIRGRLKTTPPQGWPGFAALAAEMRLSEATLRRQLRTEGQSFAALKGELQSVEAQRLLRETRLSVAEIADALGYSEAGAFYRAFRKWTGQSPGAFRRAE